MMLLMMSVLSVVIFPLPLVITSWLLGYLFHLSLHVFRAPLVRQLTVYTDGKMFVGTTKTYIQQVSLSFLPLMIRIITQEKQSVSIWRDACSDAEYRRLIVLLKQVEK